MRTHALEAVYPQRERIIMVHRIVLLAFFGILVLATPRLTQAFVGPNPGKDTSATGTGDVGNAGPGADVGGTGTSDGSGAGTDGVTSLVSDTQALFLEALQEPAENAVSGTASPTEVALGSTLEFRLDDARLMALAQELQHDPRLIFRYLREQIDSQPYLGSRKGAWTTHLTRAGNDWDQASLLIALLRIAGIPARYARVKDSSGTYGPVFVQAWLPLNDYRGTRQGEDRDWIPLSSIDKEYEFAGTRNLFAKNARIRAPVFDFSGYLESVRSQTALEAFETKMTQFAAGRARGRSKQNLKAIAMTRTLRSDDFDLLPLSLPYAYGPKANLAQVEAFYEISSAHRNTVEIALRSQDEAIILEQSIVLPAVVGRTLAIAFEAATDEDAEMIAAFGGIANTPKDVGAFVVPVLILDGQPISKGSPVLLGDDFTTSYVLNGFDLPTRSAKPTGTLCVLRFDRYSASAGHIDQLKRRLFRHYQEGYQTDQQRMSYLASVADLMGASYQLRQVAAEKRTFSLLHLLEKHPGLDALTIYTPPTTLFANDVAAVGTQTRWFTDAHTTNGALYRDVSAKGRERYGEHLRFDHPLARLARNLVYFSNSMQEGQIFEET